jgi:hypothetical protein
MSSITTLERSSVRWSIRDWQIEFLHEFPFAAWQRLPSLKQGSDGYWRLPEEVSLKVPLLFSVKARKA